MSLLIQNLSFARDDKILFHSLNFTIKPGEILQVQGQNGSGKSTFLRVVAGYIEPQEGQIKTVAETERRYLGHRNALQPHLTVLENLKWYAALMATSSAESLSLLKKVELHSLAHSLTSALSAGQARRLAIAKLLLSPGKLWILDEPTSSLDANGQMLLRKLIEAYLTDGGTVIIATHHDVVGTVSHRLQL